MSTGQRSSERAAIAAAAVVLVALGACGAGGQTPGGKAPASTSTSSSSKPASPSATPTVYAVVPSSVLATSLATKILGTSYKVDATDTGDYSSASGLDISGFGEYMSGDRGCLSLMNPHTVNPESFAYVGMSNKTGGLDEVAESYANISQAREVMTENAAQAKTCRTFKMRDSGTGEVVTYRHSATAMKSPDTETEIFLHNFNGGTAKYQYQMHLFEGRLGGEVMNIMWASQNFVADPSPAAWTHFETVINDYRKDHPRGDGGGGGGSVAPVTSAATGSTTSAQRAPSNHRPARPSAD